jgi:hypothetical protein
MVRKSIFIHPKNRIGQFQDDGREEAALEWMVIAATTCLLALPRDYIVAVLE